MGLPQIVSRDEWLVARRPGADRHDRALPGEAGLDLPLVLVLWQRFQLRLPRHPGRVGHARRVHYRTPAEHEEAGTSGYVEGEQPVEGPGRSCFLRDGAEVFHTYSVYARGLETIGGSYYMLDETALGRQEDWEEPKGRATDVRDAALDFAT